MLPVPPDIYIVGGLRTALYAYLLAKQNKGQFLLRIEDTDRERFVADGTLNILKSLYWAGIIPDEGVKLDADASGENQIIQEGKKGSYIQSERLEIYQKYAQELVAKGHAYYCFCSSERLTALREQQSRLKQPTSYDGLCAQINPRKPKKGSGRGEMRYPPEDAKSR